MGIIASIALNKHLAFATVLLFSVIKEQRERERDAFQLPLLINSSAKRNAGKCM